MITCEIKSSAKILASYFTCSYIWHRNRRSCSC